jgi:cytidine deaminase
MWMNGNASNSRSEDSEAGGRGYSAAYSGWMMTQPSDDDLITAAQLALNSQQIGEAYVADVGCALSSETGHIYSGASIGTYLGICAEQGAVSAMVTRERPRVHSIVAVWNDDRGQTHVLPPCGRCREFLRGLSQDNLETRVILGRDHVVKLRELLPYHGWHAEPV